MGKLFHLSLLSIYFCLESNKETAKISVSNDEYDFSTMVIAIEVNVSFF